MVLYQTTEEQQGARRLTDARLGELSAFVAKRMGLRFPRDRWGDLERGLRSAAREFDFEDPEACARWVLSSPLSKDRIEVLGSHLTIGETYFFRDKSALDDLEQLILPELTRSRLGHGRRLKILSAGCATGEEAYSIAIQVTRAIPDYQEWNISIIAMDINTRFLRKASEGVYSKWSFRGTPEWVKERYFLKGEKDQLEILPRIKQMVDFGYLNLCEDVYPSFFNNLYGVDIIFCCNVLMYFVPEQAQEVLKGFHRLLVDGGWLIVGPTDQLHVKMSEFVPVESQNVNLFRKDVADTFPPQEFGRIDSTPPLERPKYLESLHPQTEIPDPDPDTVGGRTSKSRILESEHPLEHDSHYAQALKLYQAGHYEKAAVTLLEWCSSNPSDSAESGRGGKEMALLVRAYANQGKLDEALAWCDKAIVADKLSPLVYYLRASILQEQGEIEGAASSVRQALFLNPDFVLGHFTLGNLKRSQGRKAQSERHFANARRLLSTYPEDAILPESEGITAGRLAKIIECTVSEREVVQ